MLAMKSCKFINAQAHCISMWKLGKHHLTSTGSSLKLCLVAEGLADIYLRFGPTMEWDTAAAQAVVEGAGGVVCDFGGVPLSYNKADLHNSLFLWRETQVKKKYWS